MSWLETVFWSLAKLIIKTLDELQNPAKKLGGKCCEQFGRMLVFRADWWELKVSNEQESRMVFTLQTSQVTVRKLSAFQMPPVNLVDSYPRRTTFPHLLVRLDVSTLGASATEVTPRPVTFNKWHPRHPVEETEGLCLSFGSPSLV